MNTFFNYNNYLIFIFMEFNALIVNLIRTYVSKASFTTILTMDYWHDHTIIFYILVLLLMLKSIWLHFVFFTGTNIYIHISRLLNTNQYFKSNNLHLLDRILWEYYVIQELKTLLICTLLVGRGQELPVHSTRFLWIESKRITNTTL